MNELIKWTNWTHKEIAVGLKNAGFCVSLPLVGQLLKKHGYVKRKAPKKQTTGINKNRNSKFENIAKLDTEYREAGNRIISFDTKKRSFREFVSSGNSLYN